MIGSGYGGSVAALRLRELGHSVTLLERGSEYRPGDFPNDLSVIPTFVRLPPDDGESMACAPSGLFEWRTGTGIAALVANGVGGGSLINAGVALRPDPDVLQRRRWPEAIRKNGLDAELELAELKLGVETWPEDRGALRKTRAHERLVDELAGRSHLQSAPLTIDARRCTRCGDCATGCNVPGAKRTLRDTYLGQARQLGVSIVHGASVWEIEPLRRGAGDAHAPADSWLIRVAATAPGGRYRSWRDIDPEKRCELEARLVVLAAGTFGSTEILQRSTALPGSRERWWISSALGRRLSANGDSLSFIADCDEPVEAVGRGADAWLARDPERGQVGPSVTSCIRRSAAKPSERLMIQDGAVPGALAPVYAELLATSLVLARLETAPVAALPAAAQRVPLARRTQVVLTMGHDGSRGEIRWQPQQDSSVPHWSRFERVKTYAHQARLLTRVAERLGATWVPDPAWQLLPESAQRSMDGRALEPRITTVHPLGGCAMGDAPATSVVDDMGRLWRSAADGGQRHENFLVLDGSIVPTSLGVNPLLTITALAERALEGLGRREPLRVVRAERERPVFDPPLRQPLAREQEQTWALALNERLEAECLRVRGPLARVLGRSEVRAELALAFQIPDATAFCASAERRIEHVTGTLCMRADADPDRSAAAVRYRVAKVHACEILAPDPYGPAWWPGSTRPAWIGLPWLRVVLSYLFMRSDVVRPYLRWSALAQLREQAAAADREQLRDLLRRRLAQVSSCLERRKIVYDLELELEPPRTAEPLPVGLPVRLRLRGRKRIQYAATWRELALGTARRLLASLQRGRAVGRPRLRASFLDQVGNLDVRLVDAAGRRARALARGRFCMDYPQLLRDAPLRLVSAGDLTQGFASLASYPLLFLRFAIQTHLHDFRLPEYRAPSAPEPVPDYALKVGGRVLPVVPDVIELEVGRGHSSSYDEHAPDEQLTLRLRRYRRPGDGLPEVVARRWHDRSVDHVKSALLVHAFAQSGHTFALQSLPSNLAGTLYQAGYEVWILEHRLSTQLPAHRQRTTLDQIAARDIPAAVDAILGRLGRELAREGRPLVDPQIHVFAQCLGAAAVMMSLLSGKLHHAGRVTPHGDGPALTCPKLASLVVSQTHPLCIGQLGSQARTWIPTFLWKMFGETVVPFSAGSCERSESEGWKEIVEQWMDRVFTALPIPPGEECPSGGADEHDAVTCRRVRFIEAPLFRHRNLSRQTHRELPLHFGGANSLVFAQAAKCIDAERLVDEDGRSVYVTEDNIREHAGLPIVFLHGEANELLHADGARESARLFGELHPECADVVARALPELVHDRRVPTWIVEEHGHLDVLIGARAPALVYRNVVRFFNFCQSSELGEVSEVAEVADAGDGLALREPSREIARSPRAGPFIGPVRAVGDHFRVRVSFIVDDRFCEGKQGANAAPGTRTWAYVRVAQGGRPAFTRLRIARRTESGSEVGRDLMQYRVAVGSVRVARASWPAQADLELEAFSVHERLGRMDERTRERQRPAALADWLEPLLAASDAEVRASEAALEGVLDDTSRLRCRPEPPRFRRACVRASARNAAAAAGPHADAVRFLAATCRYPGFPFDQERADHAVQRVLADWKIAGPEARPAFGLLLGDQIYADATAGIVDPLTPMERFVERQRSALRRSSRPQAPALGDLLAELPTIMIPDDHEYIEGYPAGEALSSRLSRSAADAWRYFQGASAPWKSGCVGFDAGPVRVIAIDTRSHRDCAKRTILSDGQRQQIGSWLRDGAARSKLNVIATSSVVLPGLFVQGDPLNAVEIDNFQWSALDHAWLLGSLAERCRAEPDFRFALLSGDYHISHFSQVSLEGRRAGVAIVAPPLYAPFEFANAAPHTLKLADEQVTLEGVTSRWSLDSVFPFWKGSGAATVHVRRVRGAAPVLYEIELDACLVDHARDDGWRARPPGLSMGQRILARI